MATLSHPIFESLTSIALQVVGLFVATIGFLALLGWIMDIPLLTTWEANTLPMAPCTALLSILFGGVFDFNARRGSTRMATLFAWFGALIALVLFTLRLLDVYWSVELLGLPITGMLGDAPLGFISSISALCFLLANVALLIMLSQGTHSLWRAYLVSALAGLITLVSCILLLGYFYGLPLSISHVLIHPALNTSIIMLFMGMGLLLFSYRWFMMSANPSGVLEINRLPYSLIFIAFTVTVFVIAYQSNHTNELKFRQGVELQLQAVSVLKVKELSQWRLERLGDGAIAQSTVINSAARQQLETPGGILGQAELQDWFGHILGNSHFGYDQGYLLDAQGIIRMSVPAKSNPIAAVLKGTSIN